MHFFHSMHFFLSFFLSCLSYGGGLQFKLETVYHFLSFRFVNVTCVYFSFFSLLFVFVLNTFSDTSNTIIFPKTAITLSIISLHTFSNVPLTLPHSPRSIYRPPFSFFQEALSDFLFFRPDSLSASTSGHEILKRLTKRRTSKPPHRYVLRASTSIQQANKPE